MKKVLRFALCAFLTLTFSEISAQWPTIQWAKCYGGSYQEQCYSIKQTPNSGFIVGGGSTSTDGDVTTNLGGIDVWIVKTTSSGTIQWQKSYGGSQSEYLRSIAVTSDGGYIFASEAYSNDSDVSGNHGVGSTDAWVVKLDDTGAIQWSKCFGNSSNELVGSVIQTIDGGFILAGTVDSVTPNHGGGDYWIVKFDSSGLEQWEKFMAVQILKSLIASDKLMTAGIL